MAEPFLGEIRQFGFNFPPRGWAFCDGQTLPISQNSALFSLLGTMYGGDGRTDFKLPDLRGRVSVHQGQGPGLTDARIGSLGGNERTVLTVDELPSHTHVLTTDVTVKCLDGPGNRNRPAGTVWSGDAGNQSATYSTNTGSLTDMADDIVEVDVDIANTGNGAAFSNMQPFLTTSFCIALVGLFPSRS